VTVLDKKGDAVVGLEPSDFTVQDEGKARPVGVFRFDGAPEAAVEPARPSPGVFTNRTEASGGPPRNVTALVLDALNTQPQDSMVARAQMMRYLKALTPETRVAVFLMGHDLRVLHDFTDDAAGLRARLDKALLGMPLENISDFARSVIDAETFIKVFATDAASAKALEEAKRVELEMEIQANAVARASRRERSLAAMEALGRHLAGIPGRKNLVWISAGFSMVSVSGNMMGNTGPGRRGGLEDFENIVRRTSQRLAQQGVALYIVDAKGIEIPADKTARYAMPMPERGRGRFESQVDAERANNDPRPAMQLMASITGGRYLYNTNDLAAGFKQTLADLRGSYTLGFYAPDEPDNKWHKLKVRVKRPGVNVRHRQGYLSDAGAAQPLMWSEETWRAVLSNPLGSTVIPLTASCAKTSTGELALNLLIDAATLHFRPAADLQVAIADRTAEGLARPRFTTFAASNPREPGISFRQQWRPLPEATGFRVVVRDMHTDQYGTLDVPFR
jgi:VWFA-related protein